MDILSRKMERDYLVVYQVYYQSEYLETVIDGFYVRYPLDDLNQKRLKRYLESHEAYYFEVKPQDIKVDLVEFVNADAINDACYFLNKKTEAFEWQSMIFTIVITMAWAFLMCASLLDFI